MNMDPILMALVSLALRTAFLPTPPPVAIGPPERPRLALVIDPKTPLTDLLPRAPRVQGKTVDLFNGDLARVPEVTFQEPLSRKLTKDLATREIAQQLARIRHLNKGKTDGFLEALIRQRTDLQGMPFVMGNACRTTGERAKLFGMMVFGVRSLLAVAADKKDKGSLSAPNAEKFWRELTKGTAEAKTEKGLQQLKALLEGKADPEANPSKDCGSLGEDLDAACVAALMQILAPEPARLRKGLVKFLSKIQHVEATQALARLALFSAEDEVRLPAVEALKGRRREDYQPILMQGFNYPLPALPNGRRRPSPGCSARIWCRTWWTCSMSPTRASPRSAK
jgi:hypothetical protein